MWLSFAILLGLALVVGLGILLISRVLCKRGPDVVKYEPYECGVEPFMGVRERFPVHFYLVAIMFIMFDIEIVFLLPWAAELRSLIATIGKQAIIEMAIFVVILLAGWFYISKNKVFDWR